MKYPLVTNAAGEASLDENQAIRIIQTNPFRSADIGRITLEEREGNPEPNVYFFEDGTSVNRVSLKNLGLNHFKKNVLPKAFEELEKDKKGVLILNETYASVNKDFGGISADELNKDPSLQYEILCRELNALNPDRTKHELNVACPNENNDCVLYEDFDLVRRILEKVEKVVGEGNYTVKVGYMLPLMQKNFVKVVSEYYPFGIVATNTMPGFMIDDSGRPYLHPESGGYCAVGGDRILPFSMYTCRRLRGQLDAQGRSDIKLIYCGGVSNPMVGYKALRYAGADYLQIGTAYMMNESDKSFFSTFSSQLIDLIQRDSKISHLLDDL